MLYITIVGTLSGTNSVFYCRWIC